MSRVKAFLLNLTQFLTVCAKIVWLSVTAPGRTSVIRCKRYHFPKARSHESQDRTRPRRNRQSS